MFFYYKYHELLIHKKYCFYGVFKNMLEKQVKCIFSKYRELLIDTNYYFGGSQSHNMTTWTNFALS